VSGRSQIWILLSLLLLLGGGFLWHRTKDRRPPGGGRETKAAKSSSNFASSLNPISVSAPTNVPFSPFTVVMTNVPNGKVTNGLANRLSNTKRALGELVKSDGAVLLRNALIDTTSGEALKVPEHLKAKGDGGSYIVQGRGAITREFREALVKAGAEVVSYVPNNAFLVRGSARMAGEISAWPSVQAVLVFEPY